MLEHSYIIFTAALTFILTPFITCITCQYPKIMLQNYRNECIEFLEAEPAADKKQRLLDHKQARYPQHSSQPPFFAYLPIIGFCYGITTLDKQNQYYFLTLELLLIGIAYFALTSTAHLSITLPYTIFYIALLTMAAIDFRSRMLPDTLTIPVMWLGLAISSMAINISYAEAVWGAILGYSVPWIIAKTTQKITKRTSMGHGDFKMIAMLGAWLGPLILVGCVFLASCIFIITFLVLAGIKKVNTKTPLAFGPFLAIAAVIALNTNIFTIWPLNILMPI